MPREKGSAENLWEGSWLPDRLWKDLIGVQEPARLLWITHTTLPKALLPDCRVLPNSPQALQSDGSMALLCALQPGVGSSPCLFYSKQPATRIGKGTARFPPPLAVASCGLCYG